MCCIITAERSADCFSILLEIMISFSDALWHLETVDRFMNWIIIPIGTAIICIVRFSLDTFWSAFQRYVHLPGRLSGCLGGVEAQDGAIPPAKDCTVTFKEEAFYTRLCKEAVIAYGCWNSWEELERYRYGPEKRQTIDVIRPTHSVQEGEAATIPILYIHGGGFVAANSAVMLHSVTAFSRAPYNFTIYSIDYPLSPEHPYPCPLLSTMQAMKFMKEQLGFDNICIMGDSAGASLALMATLWASEGFDMPELSCGCCYSPIHPSQLPHILGVASVYGVLDAHSWHATHCGRVKSISANEQAISEFAIEASMRMYAGNPNLKKGQPTQFLDAIKKMPPRAAWSLPPINLQCGGKDILVNSTKATYEYLRKRGARVTMKIYPNSRHAFVGMPPAWVGWQDSRPATKEIAHFFYDISCRPVNEDDEPKSPSSTVGSTTAPDSS